MIKLIKLLLTLLPGLGLLLEGLFCCCLGLLFTPFKVFFVCCPNGIMGNWNKHMHPNISSYSITLSIKIPTYIFSDEF